jgi:hypothetical protein
MTEVKSANIEKLRKILGHIHAHGNNYDQLSWCSIAYDPTFTGEEFLLPQIDNGDAPDCGTTLCFAGWSAFLHAPSGARIISFSDTVRFRDGRSESIKSFAMRDLNLSVGVADLLFVGCKDLQDVEFVVEGLRSKPDATVLYLVRYVNNQILYGFCDDVERLRRWGIQLSYELSRLELPEYMH